jgi:tetratricopeptide (TPR) repeat protein
MKKALFLLPLFFLNCSQSSDQTSKSENTSQASIVTPSDPKRFIDDCRQLLREAQINDSILLGQTEVNKSSAIKGINSFTAYASYCHNDSLSPIYFIKSAQVARAIGNIPQAKFALEKCLDDYPRFRDRAAALFLLAQLYDDTGYMQDEKQAEKLYRNIITDYPQSDWALSAQGALNFIGKTDEQIMQELKNNLN